MIRVVGFQDNAGRHASHVRCFHPQFRPMHLLSHSPPSSWSPPPHPTHFTSEISSFPQRNQRALHQKTTSPAVQCSRPPTTMRFRRAVTMLVTTSIQGHTHSPGLVANWLLRLHSVSGCIQFLRSQSVLTVPVYGQLINRLTRNRSRKYPMTSQFQTCMDECIQLKILYNVCTWRRRHAWHSLTDQWTQIWTSTSVDHAHILNLFVNTLSARIHCKAECWNCKRFSSLPPGYL
jgi:hypothetical protein